MVNIIKKYCECNYDLDDIKIEKGILICNKCKLPIECEFSYLKDNPHPATSIHIDYAVCDEHLDIAVDNVYNRTM